jgi:two-component system, response regulator YesN
MCGLLVADDEAIVRSAVVSMIKKGAPKLGPIIEAASGDEAISVARQSRPNIILMDVKMPGVNGLDAMRAIRAESANTKVIILTAYDEFSFSQEALRLGAVDYLLKPVRPSVLLSVLERTQKQCEIEEESQKESEQVATRLRDALPLVEDRLVWDLINGPETPRLVVERILCHLDKSVRKPAVMVVDVDHFSQATSRMDQERIGRLCSLITDIVRRVVGDPERCLVSHLRPGVVAAIVSTEDRLSTITEIRSLGHAVRSAVEAAAPVTVTVGIGHAYNELGQVRASYNEAVRAQWHRFYYGTNSVIHFDDIKSLDIAPRPYPVQLERELITQVRHGERERSKGLLCQIVDHLLETPDELPEIIPTRALELAALLSRAVIDSGAPATEVLKVSHQIAMELGQLKTGDDVRLWAERSLGLLMDQVPCGDNGDRLVDAALDHMRGHLSTVGLELKDVARANHVSASHLAHLIKAKSGASFLKHLTRLRMEEALRLLSTTDLTISTIATMVGYEDAAYFHRVFRREVACTPSSYRQKSRRARA